MSFNPKGKNPPSSREAEVLERQRLMATRLKNTNKAKPPPPPSKATTCSICKRSNFKTAKEAAEHEKHCRTKKLSFVKTKGAGTTTSPILIGGEITAEMALEHARRRAAARRNTQQPTSVMKNDNEKKPAAKPPSSSSKTKRPTVRRTTSSLAATSNRTTKMASSSHSAQSSAVAAAGSLSSLLMSNADTAKYMKPNAPKLLQHYNKIEPNDYWKNIRDWDFLGELNDKMGNNSYGKRINRDGNSDGHATTKPLPDTFDSYRQYCALWAPLCLEEARAQLLSEAISDIPYWRSKPEKSPIKVFLQPLKKDLDGSSENMGVQVKNVLTDNYKDRSFIANDIVLLLKKESSVWDASKGNLYKPDAAAQKPPSVQTKDTGRLLGLVGHIEYSRRSTEGITIQVSRKLWSQVGSQEMTLVKLGSNITALREFTALCRMDSIPLLDYILGSKMSHYSPVRLKKKRKLNADVNDDGGDGGNDDVMDATSREKLAKKEILSKMGGSSALGKGFADHASHKYNISQLGAIAASAQEYGGGGFTLIKGPPGTGKTTTLCALINALHIRQMNHYFGEVKKLAESFDAVVGKRATLSLSGAAKKRPRILVCAPSNAAVDNVIMKIMEDGFVDGNGCRYNPSIVRVGVGQSASVRDVCLGEKVDNYMTEAMDVTKLDNTIEGYKSECRRIHSDIVKLRERMTAMKKATPYPLAKEWEVRIDENACRVFYVNHKDKRTTFECPPPPEEGQRHFHVTAMPEYKSFLSQVVKLVERYNNLSTKAERYMLCQNVANESKGGTKSHAMNTTRQQLECHILDSVHIVMTTLGTAGNRALEACNKFEVVVIDEAAQSVEPSTLAGLQLGSSHAILVGDPQQLPATIFSMSGRNTKFDRSLFQRLEEAGHEVHMLNTQYRMHPSISDFPRRIFYDGKLLDGPNVKNPEYGNPLKKVIFQKFHSFEPFTVLDLESTEERGGTSLSNTTEAQFALHLFNNLKTATGGLSTKSRVAVITPYAQQAALLRRTFASSIGTGYERFVEVNTVDAFQGREANIVIFSCVRAAGSKGIGFLSDVRRMNVALTRAKNFLFVIARCSSIVVNPYWRDLVDHAQETDAVVKVPFNRHGQSFTFPELTTLKSSTNDASVQTAMNALSSLSKKS